MPFAFALRAGLFAMALFATALTAGAYLQSGHYHGDVPPIAAGSGGSSASGGDLGGTGSGGGGTQKVGGDDPSSPVPEPGTMALISMGLLALGMAGRGRRVNS